MPLETRLVSSTSWVWPTRCSRPRRCSICIGFHGRSILIITWQNCRLRPSPADSVDSSTGTSSRKAPITAFLLRPRQAAVVDGRVDPAARTAAATRVQGLPEGGEHQHLLAAAPRARRSFATSRRNLGRIGDRLGPAARSVQPSLARVGAAAAGVDPASRDSRAQGQPPRRRRVPRVGPGSVPPAPRRGPARRCPGGPAPSRRAAGAAATRPRCAGGAPSPAGSWPATRPGCAALVGVVTGSGVAGAELARACRADPGATREIIS